jgi:hypothetical protein
MKFVDTLMDSGLNDAVSTFHYAIRFNRLFMARALESLLTLENLEDFWAAYSAGDDQRFAQLLATIEERLTNCSLDGRTRELLLDACQWAIKNPERLLYGTRSPLDSPNVVALTLLINGLHQMHEDRGVVVGTFIHDEQQQFGKYLEIAYDFSKQFASADPTSPLALMTNIKDMATFDCSFQQKTSKHSFGLQILDVCLWIMKRFDSKPDAINGKCRELCELIGNASHISRFSCEALNDEVVRQIVALNNSPMTPEQERHGRRLLAEMDLKRKARMLGLELTSGE